MRLQTASSAWRFWGGCLAEQVARAGLIPSSKGITIFRHHGLTYKEFTTEPSKCYGKVSFNQKCYCKWRYDFESGKEQNELDTLQVNKIDNGGYHIIAYDFSFKISSLK